MIWVSALTLATHIEGTPDWRPAWHVASGLVYTISSVLCHQRPERSGLLWGAQFPVCARCAGLYFGAVVAGLVVWCRPSAAPMSGSRARAAAVAAAAPAALTLLYEWALRVAPGNGVRFGSGLVLGGVLGWIVLRNTMRQSVAIH